MTTDTLKDYYKTSNPVINDILTIAKPYLEDLTMREIARVEKDFKNGKVLRPMSNWEIETFEINLIYDVVRAISKHVLNTDKLVGEITFRQDKGEVVIECSIERDNVEYWFSTRVIGAGGYNIQCYHYRYITNTTLPRTASQLALTEFKAKMAKRTKLERLTEELENLVKYKIRDVENLIAAEKITQEEIYEEETPEKYGYTFEENGGNFENIEAYKEWWVRRQDQAWVTHNNRLQYMKNQLRYTKKDIAKKLAKLNEVKNS